VHNVLALHLGLTSQNYEFIATFKADPSLQNNLELLFLYLTNFLRANRVDLAQKKLLEMKLIDDEDILSLLAQVYINVRKKLIII
jgi:hypothetical protein